MNMNLKNYTSTVPASRSISRIEEMLVAVGAKNINKQYNDGRLCSVIFLVDVNGTTASFKLPAKIDVVEKVLKAEIKRPRADTYKKIEAQSERTAWKIVCDWVEIQCTMIKLEQVELAQVFLPYFYDPVIDQTLWERVESGQIKLLA